MRDYSLAFHAPLKPWHVIIQVGNHMVVAHAAPPGHIYTRKLAFYSLSSTTSYTMSSLQSFFDLFTTPESQDLFLEWPDPADSILNHFVSPNKSSIFYHSRKPKISRRTCVQCIAGCAWTIRQQWPYTEHPPIICTYEPYSISHAQTMRKNCEACYSKHKSCDQVSSTFP